MYKKNKKRGKMRMMYSTFFELDPKRKYNKNRILKDMSNSLNNPNLTPKKYLIELDKKINYERNKIRTDFEVHRRLGKYGRQNKG